MSPIALPERLESERLTLRVWRAADVDALHEALAESVEHLARWIPWATDRAPTPDAVSGLLAGWVAQRLRGDNVIYAAFDGSGRLLGGFGAYARVGDGALELGYWLRASAAGRGYATEATRRLADAALEVPGVERLEIHTDVANTASRRVADKLGFVQVQGGGARGGVVYARTRSAADPRNAPPRPGVG